MSADPARALREAHDQFVADYDGMIEAGRFNSATAGHLLVRLAQAVRTHLMPLLAEVDALRAEAGPRTREQWVDALR